MKKETPDHYRQELSRSEARLKQIEEQGIQALSRCDIEIASGGNAEQALSTAKMLVSNHIKYYRRLLDETPEQLNLL